jgi:ubiquinone/menaquinone biosynthesis C-methylase UbiE
MNKNILAFFQATNKGYIHPKGKKATQILLNELDPFDGEKILEIGFGTGASLIQTFSHNPSIKLFGVEKSKLMLEKASSRIKFCGLENKIILSLIEEKTHIPFPSNFFDKIYIESVLAIQKGSSLEKMIQELKRILKPKGILCINELLWNTKVPMVKIQTTNKFVLENFGIIQANGKHPYIKDWEDLFQKNNFILNKSINLNECHHFDSIKNNINSNLLLSQIYSLWGQLKSKIFIKHTNEWSFYKSKMKKIDNQIILDPYLLKFIKSN